MKPRAGIVTVLLGLALLPGELAAGEQGEAAKPAKTRMHRQLNQLIRKDAGVVLPAAAPVEDVVVEVAPEVVELEPMIIEGEKLKDLPPPETQAAIFFRTGTVWERVGRRFTKRFWMKGDQGIMFSISW
jgi:hypothetical protein